MRQQRPVYYRESWLAKLVYLAMIGLCVVAAYAVYLHFIAPEMGRTVVAPEGQPVPTAPARLLPVNVVPPPATQPEVHEPPPGDVPRGAPIITEGQTVIVQPPATVDPAIYALPAVAPPTAVYVPQDTTGQAAAVYQAQPERVTACLNAAVAGNRSNPGCATLIQELGSGR